MQGTIQKGMIGVSTDIRISGSSSLNCVLCNLHKPDPGYWQWTRHITMSRVIFIGSSSEVLNHDLCRSNSTKQCLIRTQVIKRKFCLNKLRENWPSVAGEVSTPMPLLAGGRNSGGPGADVARYFPTPQPFGPCPSTVSSDKYIVYVGRTITRSAPSQCCTCIWDCTRCSPITKTDYPLPHFPQPLVSQMACFSPQRYEISYLVIEDAVGLLAGRVDQLDLTAGEADQKGGRIRRALGHAEVVACRTRALVHPLVDRFCQIHCLWGISGW